MHPIVASKQQRNTYIKSHSTQFNVVYPPDLDPARRDERIAYYRDKPLEWMRFYLRSQFKSPPAAYHPKLIDALQLRGRLNLIAVQRGGGKGTLLKGFTAHTICYGLEPYLTRMEHDGQIAKNELLNLVQEFRSNPYILADYGNLLGDAHGLPMALSEGAVFFVPPFHTNPLYHTCYVRFIGLDMMIRGTVTLDQARVGRVIVNDPTKGYTEAVSAAHTRKVISVLKADVGFSGASFQDHEQAIAVTVVGTPIAKSDVIDTLSRDPTVRVLMLPGVTGAPDAIEGLISTIQQDMPNIMEYVQTFEDAHQPRTSADHAAYLEENAELYERYVSQLESQWVDRYPICDHVFLAATWSTDTWRTEVLMQVLESQRKKFWREWFVPYHRDDIPALCEDMTWYPTTDWKYVMTIDLAGQPKRANDPKAMIALAYHPRTKDYYVLAYWCAHCTAEQWVTEFYALFWEAFPWYHGQGVEIVMEDTVSFSGIGVEYIEEVRLRKLRDAPEKKDYWCKLPIQSVAPVTMGNKLEGIGTLVPIAEQRKIHVIPHQTMQDLLVDQFDNHRGVPTHTVDDITRKNEGGDVFRMAKFTLERPVQPVVMGVGNIPPPPQKSITNDPLQRRK